MNNKIILTESQYSRLLEFIEEAGKKAAKMKAKQEPQPKAKVEPNMDAELSNPKFKKMKDELLNQKPNTAIIFDLIDGTKITMCIGAVNGSKFTLKVTRVKGDVKKEYYIDNIVEMDINSLELVKDEEDSSEYKIKIRYYKVKKTFKNDELFFNTINVGTPCTIEEPTQAKPEEERPEEETPEEETPEEETPEEILMSANKAYKLILSDPKLKQAFYKAPSLWNLFMSELKGKQASGTGIVPTLQLVGGYYKNRYNKKLGIDWVDGGKVVFSFKDGKEIEGVIKNGKLDRSPSIISNDKKFEMELIDKTRNPNIFKVKFINKKDTKKEKEGFIRIYFDKSSGIKYKYVKE